MSIRSSTPVLLGGGVAVVVAALLAVGPGGEAWPAALALAAVAVLVLGAAWGAQRLGRERDLRALYESLEEVSSATDVRAVLTTVAGRAADALGALDGVIMIRSGEDLRAFSATRSEVEPLASVIGHHAFTQPSERELPSVRVIRTGAPLVIHDVDDHQGPAGFREACAAAGVASVLCVPIRSPVPEGEDSPTVIGSLNLGFQRPRTYGPREIGLASAYGAQAATALGRALVHELEQEALAKLRELDELKSDFISSASHELHTPLTSICGFSELLLGSWDELDDSLRHGFLERIDGQARQLAGLIDDLLDIARLESGDVGPRGHLDLRLLVIAAVDQLRDVIGGHRVVVDIAEGITVQGNQAGVERILYNLLTNAAKYSPPDSRITVQARTGTDEVTLGVRDRGVGIAPHERDKVFERFYRIRRGDTAPRGTGLGLPIAKRFTEAMGGRIWVESEPGRGSTFWFTLPRPRHGSVPRPPVEARRRAG